MAQESYFDELCCAMDIVATHPRSLFLGQAVKYSGTGMTNSLMNVAKEKLIEMPVEEDLQMGASIGMSLVGFLPLSIFPRWNFLLLATNQLVNHLDKLPIMADWEVAPKVIIRTAVGSENPLHPGPQHVGDFTEAFRHLTQRINIVLLDDKKLIVPEYKKALDRDDGVSTILVELSDLYSSR
jgi:pyruvate/2-oxoglutarate/acetoin dehydrogenase E1 component